MTVDGESVESSCVGNTELTAAEREQLQQNMRYISPIRDNSDVVDDDLLSLMSKVITVVALTM